MSHSQQLNFEEKCEVKSGMARPVGLKGLGLLAATGRRRNPAPSGAGSFLIYSTIRDSLMIGLL